MTSHELGDPVGGTTAYALCLWNATTPALRSVAQAGSNATCGGCWRAKGAGLVHQADAASTGGIAALRLKPGNTGKASVHAKACEPTPAPFTAPVTVVVMNDAGVC
jgi:hypothetical protein